MGSLPIDNALQMLDASVGAGKFHGARFLVDKKDEEKLPPTWHPSCDSAFRCARSGSKERILVLKESLR